MNELEKLLAKRSTLLTQIDDAKTEDELNQIQLNLRKLDMQIEEEKRKSKEPAITEPIQEPVEPRTAAVTQPSVHQEPVVTRGFNPVANTNMQTQDPDQRTEDITATVSYRKAFMDYCVKGTMSKELRANATTATADASAVIPSTILNEVIRKVQSYGSIYSRVRKLNVRGGLTIPILSLKPTATWIGSDTSGNFSSDRKKVQANTNISFSYYGLECKVSTTLLADTVTLVGFEETITDLIVEAMVKALDLAILKGTGSSQPQGICTDSRIPTSQIVTLTPAEVSSFSSWKKKVFAKMPLSYKAGAEFIMASGTWEGYIDGMVDTTGQPIGRINYGISDGIQERFGGKAVLQVEDDIIAPWDDAATGDVVAIYCNLKNYGFNSNMTMTMYRYFDQDKNEWIDKAILIADGKIIDPNGVVIVKKGAAGA